MKDEAGAKGFAILMHHWGAFGCNAPHCPTVLAIATLRAHNAEVPIYVLDCAHGGSDWRDFPRTLNFNVERRPLSLGRSRTDRSILTELCSKTFDVWKFSQEIKKLHKILFMDSDIFWLRDPLPLAAQDETQRLCVRPENTGLYYFDPESPLVAKQFEFWMTATKRCLSDSGYRNELFPNSSEAIHDESIFGKIAKRELCFDIPMEENRRLKSGISSEELLSAHNLHLMRVFWGKRKDSVALLIQEIFEAIKRSLGPVDRRYLFGTEQADRSPFPLESLSNSENFAVFSREVLRAGQRWQGGGRAWSEGLRGFFTEI